MTLQPHPDTIDARHLIQVMQGHEPGKDLAHARLGPRRPGAPRPAIVQLDATDLAPAVIRPVPQRHAEVAIVLEGERFGGVFGEFLRGPAGRGQVAEVDGEADAVALGERDGFFGQHEDGDDALPVVLTELPSAGAR